MQQKDIQQFISAMQEVFPTAEMVKRGFDAVDARFDAMDKRFDKLEQRVVNLESDMTYLKARISEIERTLDKQTEIFEEHSKELQRIHRKIDEWTDPRNTHHHITHKEFSVLESRVSILEKKVVKR